MKSVIAAMKNRLVVSRSFATVLCLVGGTMFLMAVPTDSERAGAFKWARSLSASERAAFSGKLASLPPEYRRALAVTLQDPVQKAELWRGYFRQYRRAHSLTAAQEAVLLSIEQRISPAMLELPESKEASAEEDAIRATVVQTFGGAVAKEILDGGPRTGNFTALPFAERTRRWWRVARTSGVFAALGRAFGPVLYAGDPVGCDCNTGNDNSDCFNPNPTCFQDDVEGGSFDCAESPGGCGDGPQYHEACDGYCANPLAGEGARRSR